jgi:hypothetical protein
MRRRTVMAKMPGRQYISDFYFPYKNSRRSLRTSKCFMFVRERESGPGAKEFVIGVWRVKYLKPKAYTHHSIAPGTFATFYENQHTKPK